MNQPKSSIFLAWIILIFLILVWGSSFILIKRGLLYFTPVELGTLRVSISFLIILPFVFKRIKRYNIQTNLILFVSGLLGNAIPAVLYALAERGLDSLSAGVLNSLTTVFALVVGLVFFNLKVKFINVIGVIIGLAGAVGLLTVSGGNTLNFNIQYGFYVILATIMYALNINIIKYYLKEIDSFSIAVMAFFYTGIISTVILFSASDFYKQLFTDPKVFEGLFYIGILAVFGTVIALILFNYLIKITNVVFSASVTYMMPIVAVMWGIWDGEKLEWYFLIWIGLIITGVLLVNTKKHVRIKLKWFLGNS
ncbi:MAG: DMT family transporter [Bacteroidetes bacterium]|nr:DMT family transporter [Bacteroidota bacterium]